MTTPSNTNTSGPEVVAWRKNVWVAEGIGTGWMLSNEQPEPNHQPTDIEPLVTAASAQARIAELDEQLAQAAMMIIGSTTRATAAEARADRLAKFGQHTNWELSHGYPDGEEEDGCWLVHSVNGGRNDREWTLIGRGETPDDAIRNAFVRHAEAFVKASRYEEASAIADKAAREIQDLMSPLPAAPTLLARNGKGEG